MIPPCPDCGSDFVPCDCHPIKLPTATVVLEGDKIPTKAEDVLSNSTDGLCAEIITAMDDMCKNDNDTVWVGPGETMFERLWFMVEKLEGRKRLEAKFPQCA